MRRLGPFALSCLALLLCLPCARAEETPLPRLIAAADHQRLDERQGWWSLLFMRERAFGPPTSMVDDDAFFLAPRDGWSMRAELHATLAAVLRAPKAGESPDAHAICRFPARYRFLASQLPELAAASPKVVCADFDAWRRELRTEAVSLVFSAYFADNPSSMFGHSFIRLKKRPLPGKIQSGMLDDSANFMAYPTTDNPFLYAALGLAGQFPGRFSIDPYYIKLQTYNNAESRDLWEYELAFDDADIASLQRVLWEMGPHVINYWYFDENCSFVIDKVLEAAINGGPAAGPAAKRPPIDLHELHPWVIPSDTLRSVWRVPGLVRKTDFQPSALTRFLGRYRSLAAGERTVVDHIVAANDPAEAGVELDLLGVDARVRVIDGVLEFIDYDENLAGTKEATTHRELRRWLLGERASLHVPKQEVAYPAPLDEAPQRTHGTTRIGGGGGYTAKAGPVAQFEWRPALHDIASPDLAYAEGLAITFFDTTLRYATRPGRAYVESWDPLTILSVPHLEWITHPFAWSLELGTENRGACADFSLVCYEEHARAGVGPVVNLGKARAYALVKAEGGGLGGFGPFLGAGGTAGWIWPLSAWVKLSASATEMRRAGREHRVYNYTRALGTAAWLMDEAKELRFEVARRADGDEAIVAFDYLY